MNTSKIAFFNMLFCFVTFIISAVTLNLFNVNCHIDGVRFIMFNVSGNIGSVRGNKCNVNDDLCDVSFNIFIAGCNVANVTLI